MINIMDTNWFIPYLTTILTITGTIPLILIGFILGREWEKIMKKKEVK